MKSTKLVQGQAQAQAQAHGEPGAFPPGFWRERGFGDHPTARQKFLALTIDELAKTGPHSFNATYVCDLLDMTYPMVNHYFGSRNGLVAEAVSVAYRSYILGLREAADRSEPTPLDRLRGWIRAQMKWTQENPGIAVVLDFPHASLDVSNILRNEFKDEMERYFQFNMAVLMQLVMDVREDRIRPIWFNVDDLPYEEFMANTDLVYRASSIAFSTLGASMWMAGAHVPSASLTVINDRLTDTMNWHIDHLIEFAAAP